MAKKCVIQIYLDEDEYAFLKEQAALHHRTMAKTLLLMANFHTHMRTTAHDQHKLPTKLKGIDFSDTPLDDYRDY